MPSRRDIIKGMVGAMVVPTIVPEQRRYIMITNSKTSKIELYSIVATTGNKIKLEKLRHGAT